MKARNVGAVASLILLGSFCAAAGCEHDPRPKQRPSDVPVSAQWVGGADVGAYYDCSTGGPVNECTVWNDTDGSVRLTGRYTLEGQNRSATYNELRYASTDGQRIVLERGLTLHPAK